MARKMLIRSLPAGWDVVVTEAANGIEALAACRTGTIDVMFLDLTMPEMDGYQVLAALRQDGMNCPVVVCSADIQPRAQERVLALGALAFVKKPLDAQKLEPVLRQYGILK